MNKALAFEVAKELGISPEKALLVCKSFHDGLKELLKKPAECKGGVHIEGFLTLNLHKYKIINSLSRENPHDIELKEQILENLKKYKGE